MYTNANTILENKGNILSTVAKTFPTLQVTTFNQLTNSNN